jgi:protocatechuate 3,4-dioxygenase beta subunit
MLSRRRILFLTGAAGASALAACARGERQHGTSPWITPHPDGAAACPTATPAEITGPFPGDGSMGPNVLIDSGIVRNDIRPSFGPYSGVADGIPVTIDLTLHDLTRDCAAGGGMAVYLWHSDRDGEYSLYGRRDQNYLRGVQVADAAGAVRFTSIFPACYAGRWPHIHFEVFDSLQEAVAGRNARLTSEIALPQHACEQVYGHDSGYSASIRNLSRVTLASDDMFRDGWDAQIATVTGDPAGGLSIARKVVVGDSPTSAPHR